MSASNGLNPASLQDTDKYKKAWVYHEWNQTVAGVEILAELPKHNRIVVVHERDGTVELMTCDKVFDSEQAAATAGWLSAMESASCKMKAAEVFKKRSDELQKAMAKP